MKLASDISPEKLNKTSPAKIINKTETIETTFSVLMSPIVLFFYLLKLSRKSQISAMKQSDVVNFIFHHREALQAEAPRKPLIFIPRIAGCCKNFLIDHTGSADLQPSGIFAGSAALAAANRTANIEFKTGFRKWKKAGPQSDLHVFMEKPGKKLLADIFEVTDIYIVSHH
jgi:hypothetical protein